MFCERGTPATNQGPASGPRGWRRIVYRGASSIKKSPAPRTIIGPWISKEATNLVRLLDEMFVGRAPLRRPGQRSVQPPGHLVRVHVYPTAGQCLGPYGGPRGGCGFL